MTQLSRPPIEKMVKYADALVAERGPVELLMAFIVHADPDPRMYDFFGHPTWELALAATWADDVVQKSRHLPQSLLPGWQSETGNPYELEVCILPSGGQAIDDLLFFMEGQTRRYPELVDIDLPGLCFRRAYVIAHRKAGIGGKLIGAAPAAAD